MATAAAAPLLLRPLFHGLLLLVVLSLALGAHGNKPGEHYNLTRENFPPGFVFGTASSAYQVEGNTLKYGRGPCIWDTFLKYPGEIESRCMTASSRHFMSPIYFIITWCFSDRWRRLWMDVCLGMQALLLITRLRKCRSTSTIATWFVKRNV